MSEEPESLARERFLLPARGFLPPGALHAHQFHPSDVSTLETR